MISAIFFYKRNAVSAFSYGQCKTSFAARPVPKVAFIQSAILTGSINNHLPDVVHVRQESYLHPVLML